MKRIILAAASAALLLAGISACGVNTNSQGYHDGYNLGEEDGAGGYPVTTVSPGTCQEIVNLGLAWPNGGVPGDSKGDFIAGFMAGCLKADGGH
jgi:hypothetical protein